MGRGRCSLVSLRAPDLCPLQWHWSWPWPLIIAHDGHTMELTTYACTQCSARPSQVVKLSLIRATLTAQGTYMCPRCCNVVSRPLYTVWRVSTASLHQYGYLHTRWLPLYVYVLFTHLLKNILIEVKKKNIYTIPTLLNIKNIQALMTFDPTSQWPT